MSFWGEFLDAGKAILFPRIWEQEQRERARQQRHHSTPRPGGPRPMSITTEGEREEERLRVWRRLHESYGEEFASNGTFDGYQALIESGRVDTEYGAVTDIFFGGRGNPLGPGHGHVVITRDGDSIVYRRNPGETHPEINSRRA